MAWAGVRRRLGEETKVRRMVEWWGGEWDDEGARVEEEAGGREWGKRGGLGRMLG